jgi:hypothetical protein
MIPSPENEQQLERAIHETLRGLPVRRAPRSLEHRVFAELQRRAALPWWAKSFGHWPVAARAVFVLLSMAMVKLVFAATLWAMAGFENSVLQEALATPVAWFESACTVGRGIASFFDILLRNIPALWLYAGLAIIATLYATLFGLGAAAYKALRAHP